MEEDFGKKETSGERNERINKVMKGMVDTIQNVVLTGEVEPTKIEGNPAHAIMLTTVVAVDKWEVDPHGDFVVSGDSPSKEVSVVMGSEPTESDIKGRLTIGGRESTPFEAYGFKYAKNTSGEVRLQVTKHVPDDEGMHEEGSFSMELRTS